MSLRNIVVDRSVFKTFQNFRKSAKVLILQIEIKHLPVSDIESLSFDIFKDRVPVLIDTVVVVGVKNKGKGQ